MVLQQCKEFFSRHTCLAKDGAECPTIKRFMIGNYNLGKRFVTPKDDVASALPLEFKSLFKSVATHWRPETCGALVIQP
jgi:hypothetical protein